MPQPYPLPNTDSTDSRRGHHVRSIPDCVTMRAGGEAKPWATNHKQRCSGGKSGCPGRDYLVDADSGHFLEMLSTGFGFQKFEFPTGSGKIYAAETYYSRGTRGTRTDVVREGLIYSRIQYNSFTRLK